MFDDYAVAWALILHDIFRLVPHAEFDCYLNYWKFSKEGYSPYWEKTTLADGRAILKFLRTPFPHLQYGVCVLLAQGVIDGARSRFAEARIAGYDRLRPYVDGWMTSDKIMTTLESTAPEDPVKVIKAISAFNYDQTLRAIRHAAKGM